MMQKKFLLSVGILSALAVFGGCEKEEEVTVYTVPKEKADDAPTMAEAEAAQDGADKVEPVAQTPAAQQGMTVLPGMEEQSAGAEQPTWEAPMGWDPQPLSTMRKGSWQLPGPKGVADLSVTAFPGDVGGLQANVSRWAQQIGVSPDAAKISELDLPSGEATLVDITEVEGDMATLAVIQPHHGYSWFYKLSGPKETVTSQRGAFLQFMETVKYH